jgi:hypothetical protein
MCKKLLFLATCVLTFGIVFASPVEAAHPDLAGWWRLDDGAGTLAVDSSGNGNDGTLQGGPTWVAGMTGSALEFDGSDDYVDCGNGSSLNITSEITISAWVYPTGSGSSDFPRIVDKSNGTGGADPGYKMYLRGADNYLITLSAGGTYLNSTGSANLNEWNFVAFVNSGAEWKFLLNGTWEQLGENPMPSLSTNSLYIGNSPAGDRHFQGILDDVRIYNTALTAEQVDAVMTGEKYPFASLPTPEDGALYADTWVNLSWSAGDFAISHDVYFSDNFDDVNEGVETAYRGNYTDTFLIVGFPGFAYSDGLVPGTTYYWRVEEVNEADPNSPWTGEVWSFSIPSFTSSKLSLK